MLLAPADATDREPPPPAATRTTSMLVTPAGTVNVPLVVNVRVVAADAGAASPTVRAREPARLMAHTAARTVRGRTTTGRALTVTY
ncbi:hypothetical protein [Streptomyces sp. NPDC051567]|uniref:hypothetical protein n=1 Tax=Streptomyces sp. NPDC051567 TaxID=3365660 RepID=UPI0037A4F5AC